ncbi:hypothetical protein D9757_003753 [Collybiopsis confluens]|uniref:Uncharacterized protein n=1 Tax=Collybiopsis confluens TaxID=2823264 RepID=A0A8H5HVA1_9AGAR|nr:hypothetical protein D9757_003753 [Collybiopsis confluens]
MPASAEKCPIAEIVQYSCELELAQTDAPVIRCFPVSRFFQMCPGHGRAAVELTTVLNIDENGNVGTATDVRQPSGKIWRKVVRYDEPSGSNSQPELRN